MTPAGLLLLPAFLLGQFCPFPVPDCHLQRDLNCDGKDLHHCQPYDIDGAVPGDCSPDGLLDDFWTFFDGSGDGIVACRPGRETARWSDPWRERHRWANGRPPSLIAAIKKGSNG